MTSPFIRKLNQYVEGKRNSNSIQQVGLILINFFANITPFGILILDNKVIIKIKTVYNLLRPNNNNKAPNIKLQSQEVFIITGISDNKWHKYNKRRVPKEWHNNIYHCKNNQMRTICNALIVIDGCHSGKNDKYLINKKLNKWFKLYNMNDLIKRNIKIHEFKSYHYKRNTRSFHTKI